MKRLFCYGTLQEPSVQLELIGRTVSGPLTSIEGYVAVRDYIDPDDGIEYPRIIAYPKGCVYGRIFSFTDDEVKLLDIYETEMYYLAEVKTKSGDVVWTYMPTI